jgi:hypothetical protein
MEGAQGIGGFFFRAKARKTLAAGYEANLGVTRVPDITTSHPKGRKLAVQYDRFF